MAAMGAMGGGGGGGEGGGGGPTSQTAPSINIIDNNRSLTAPGSFGGGFGGFQMPGMGMPAMQNPYGFGMGMNPYSMTMGNPYDMGLVGT